MEVVGMAATSPYAGSNAPSSPFSEVVVDINMGDSNALGAALSWKDLTVCGPP